MLFRFGLAGFCGAVSGYGVVQLVDTSCCAAPGLLPSLIGGPMGPVGLGRDGLGWTLPSIDFLVVLFFISFLV